MGTNVSFYIASSEPEASSSYAGALLFNSTTKKISRCKDDGSAWEAYGGADCNVIVKTDTGDYASNQQQGILYVNTYDKTLKLWNGSSWVTVAKAPVTSVRASGSATNDDIPTEAAVRSAIDTAVSGITVDVSSGTSSSNSGKAPQLDANGMLPSYVVPAYAISEFVGTFDSLTELTTAAGTSGNAAYSAEKGDYAIIKFETGSYNTDGSEDGTYVLSGSTKTSSSSWTRISTPDTDTTYDLATTSTAGIVQPDGTTITVSSGVISAAASWRPIKVDGTSKLSDSATAIDFVGGTNVTLSYSNGAITIAATDTTYSVATASTSGVGGTDGLMSATDKEKLNSLSTLTWQTVSNS